MATMAATIIKNGAFLRLFLIFPENIRYPSLLCLPAPYEALVKLPVILFFVAVAQSHRGAGVLVKYACYRVRYDVTPLHLFSEGDELFRYEVEYRPDIELRVFEEAYARVRSRFSDDAWFAMPPRAVTDEIYKEIRQIDAERAGTVTQAVDSSRSAAAA